MLADAPPTLRCGCRGYISVESVPIERTWPAAHPSDACAHPVSGGAGTACRSNRSSTGSASSSPSGRSSGGLGAPAAIERNRLQIARAQWELAHALIDRYLPAEAAETAA